MSHIVASQETHLGYVPFSLIDWEEGTYDFRLETERMSDELAGSLERLGQTHPMIVAAKPDGRFLLIDGYRRCAAAAQMQGNGVVWEKMLAHTLSLDRATPPILFRLLRDRNLWGDRPYGLIETGRFFNRFFADGLTVAELAAESELTPEEVKSFMELTFAPPAFESRVNHLDMDPRHALALLHRYLRCRQTPWAPYAERILDAVLDAADGHGPTDAGWRFILDFHWGLGKPFLPLVTPRL